MNWAAEKGDISGGHCCIIIHNPYQAKNHNCIDYDKERDENAPN